MKTRQKVMLERLDMLEKKLNVLQETVGALPETQFCYQIVDQTPQQRGASCLKRPNQLILSSPY